MNRGGLVGRWVRTATIPMYSAISICLARAIRRCLRQHRQHRKHGLQKGKPAGRSNRPAGLWRGGANRDYCVRQMPANVGPGAPGQKRIARTSPFPEIRTAGQQRAISKARSVRSQESRPLALAGKLQPRSCDNEQRGVNLSLANKAIRALAGVVGLFSTACSIAQIVPGVAGTAGRVAAACGQVVAHSRLGTRNIALWFAQFLPRSKWLRCH
jgi:hypothetical protein